MIEKRCHGRISPADRAVTAAAKALGASRIMVPKMVAVVADPGIGLRQI
ncbi:MAG: hypothetical protein AAF603_10550 [Pseudomonadota bacterium]